MTEKITSVSSMPKKVKKTASRSQAEQAAVRELVKAARARGEDLTGPEGLLKSITAIVLETALGEELIEHLGHEKHQAPTADSGKHPQRHPPQDGAHRRRRGGEHRGPAGSGRHVRAGHRPSCDNGACRTWTPSRSACSRKG